MLFDRFTTKVCSLFLALNMMFTMLPSVTVTTAYASESVSVATGTVSEEQSQVSDEADNAVSAVPTPYVASVQPVTDALFVVQNGSNVSCAATPTVTYGDTITFRIQSGESTMRAPFEVGYYESGAEYAETLVSADTATDNTFPCVVALPSGSYELIYSYTFTEDNAEAIMYMNDRNVNYLQVSPVALSQPVISWNGTTASWNSVTTAVNGITTGNGTFASGNITYRYQVKRNGTVIADTTTSSCQIDISSYLTEPATYSVSVQAVSGATQYYTDSAFTDSDYAETDAPQITSFTKKSGAVGVLEAQYSDDGTGLKEYSFALNSTPSWQSAQNTKSTQTSTKKVNEAGSYRFFAKDYNGNIASSTNTIEAYCIHFYDFYLDGSRTGQAVPYATDSNLFLLDDQSISIRDFITTTPTKEGYVFLGWCTEDATQTDLPDSTILTASSSSIYARWRVADQHLNVSASGENLITTATDTNELSCHAVYSSTGITVTLSAGLGVSASKISWIWSDGSDATSSRTFRDVSESGIYAVTATAIEDGNTLQATATVIIDITPRELTYKVKNQAIGFNDDPPAFSAVIYGFVSGENTGNAKNFAMPFSTDYVSGSALGTYSITATPTAANYTFRLTTQTDYTGTLTVTEKAIAYSSLTDFSFSWRKTAYNEATQTPDLTITYKGISLVSGTDYTVTLPATSVNAGNYQLSVTFKGNYTGSRTFSYTITKATPTGLQMNVPSFEYNGSQATGSVTNLPSELSSHVTYSFYQYSDAGKNTKTAISKAVDAGSYYVEATVSGSDNYYGTAVTGTDFSIDPVPIVITANSNSWTYDGNAHTDTGYTLNRELIGTDSINYVIVAAESQVLGCGTYANKVKEYALSGSTKASNYSVTTVDGTLTILRMNLPYPANAVWSSSAYGTAQWIPVTREGVQVYYLLHLYARQSGSDDAGTLIKTASTTDVTLDFSSDIRAYAQQQLGTDMEFYYDIQACVQSGSGTGNEKASNYLPSSLYKSTQDATNGIVRTVLVCAVKKSGIASALINGQENYWGLTGEKLTLTVTAQSGYSVSNGAVIWEASPSNITIEDAAKADTTAVIGSGSGSITLYATAEDEFPYFTDFSGVYVSGSSGDILLTIEANDSVGLMDFFISKELITATDYASITSWTSFGTVAQTASGSTLIAGTDTSCGSGTYYAYVRDTAGQVTRCDETVTVYTMTFVSGGGTGTMTSVLKPENAAFTLPSNQFTRSNYEFSHWVANKVSYNDQDTFYGNADTVFTAEWTKLTLGFTVEYFYMDTDGNYATACDAVSSVIKAEAGSTISYSDSSFQQPRTGFTLDEDCASKSLTVTSGKSLVIQLYYRRTQHTVSYSYIDPETGSETDLASRSNYYGQSLGAEPSVPSIDGYVFNGWVYEKIGSKPSTMGLEDLKATGSYSKLNTEYIIEYYQRNLDNTQYTKVESTAVKAMHGSTVSYDAIALNSYVGFTCQGLVFTNKTASDSDLTMPETFASSSSEGTVSAITNQHLRVLVYYERNEHTITLNLYRTDADGNSVRDAAHRLYQTVSVSYKYGENVASLTSLLEEDTYLTEKESSFTNLSTLPIDGYSLARYLDWSCKDRPDTMPDADVILTREYVRNPDSCFHVKIYYETTTQGSYVLQTTLNNYAPTGSIISITDSGTNGGKVVNYDGYTYMSNMAYYHFSHASYTGLIVSDTSVSADNAATVSLYYDRNEVQTRVRYIERTYTATGTCVDKVITSTNITGRWGTKFTADLQQEFGSSSDLTSYRSRGYTISYSYGYLNESGHYPSGTEEIKTVAGLTAALTGNVFSKISSAGAGGADTLPTNAGYFDIYYTLQPDTAYALQFVYRTYASNGYDEATRTHLKGTYLGTSYNVYVTNADTIFTDACASVTDSIYPGIFHYHTKGTGTVLNTAEGFTTTTTIGEKTCYYNDGSSRWPEGLYMADEQNQFYFGQRAYYSAGTSPVGYEQFPQYLEEYKEGQRTGTITYQLEPTCYNHYFYATVNGGLIHDYLYYFDFHYYRYYINYSLDGRACTHGYYYKGSSVVSQTNTVSSDTYHESCSNGSFTERLGYTLHWYFDSAYQYPVSDYSLIFDETGTPTYIKDYTEGNGKVVTYKNSVFSNDDEDYDYLTLYGRYDSNTITNKAYLYYELPDGSWCKDTSECTVSYTSSTDYPFVDSFNADRSVTKVTRYYKDGNLAIVELEISSETFHNVSFTYENYYTAVLGRSEAETGFTFSSEFDAGDDSVNMTSGYTEDKPITFSLYLSRSRYTLTRQEDPDDATVHTDTLNYLYGQEVDTLDVLTKDGYTFRGWTVRAEGKADILVCQDMADNTWLGEVSFDATGTALFHMPDTDITAVGTFDSASYTQLMVHYYPDEQGKYEAEAVDSLGNVAQGYTTDSNLNVYNANHILVAKVDYTTVTSDQLYPLAGFATMPTGALYQLSQVLVTTQEGMVTEYLPTATYTALYGDTISLYYSSDACQLQIISLANDNGDVSANFSGDGTYLYNEEVTVSVSPHNGYTFDGWYIASTTTLLSTATSYLFYIKGDTVLEAHFTADIPHQPTLSISGTKSYPYGHKYTAGDVLTVSVQLNASDTDAVDIVSYQWQRKQFDSSYLDVFGKQGTSMSFSEKNTGTYTYRCRVILKNRVTGRVRMFDSPDFTVTVIRGTMDFVFSSYDDMFDGQYHSISYASGTNSPDNAVIWYATEELTPTSFDAASKTNTPISYRDVELDGEGQVVAHKIYYYVVDPAGNYNPQYGYEEVTVRPRTLSISTKNNAFIKTYDGQAAITGADYERLSKIGDYFTISGAPEGVSITGAKVEFTAAFNDKHVDTAKIVYLTNIKVLLSGSSGTDINYEFPETTDYIISGYIQPHEISVQWSGTALTYNGSQQGPTPSIASLSTLPDTNLVLKNAETYENVGTYKANAQLVAPEGTDTDVYHTSDYSLQNSSVDFTIEKYKVTVGYRDVTYTYDGKEHYPVLSDIATGTGALQLPGEDGLLVLSSVSIKKSFLNGLLTATNVVRNADTYTQVQPASSVFQKVSGGRVTTVSQNFDVTYALSTITVVPREVTASGITAEDKVYDGTTLATLSTLTSALDNVVTGEYLYLNSANLTGTFVSSSAGNNKTINITYGSSLGSAAFTAGAGTLVENYVLNTGSPTQLSTAATILQDSVHASFTVADVVYGQDIVLVPSYTDAQQQTVAVGTVSGSVVFSVNGATVTSVPGKNGNYTIYASELQSLGCLPAASDTSYVISADVSNLRRDGADNYAFTATDTSVTVHKRPVSIQGGSSFAGITKVYDGTDTATADNNSTLTQLGSYRISVVSGNSNSGIFSTDTVLLSSCTATYNKEDVTATRASVSDLVISNDNYVFANSAYEVKGSITKYTVTVTPTNMSKTYGYADPSFTFVSDKPASGTEIQNVTITRSAGDEAGTYTTIATVGENLNYTVKTGTGVFTIKKQVLTVYTNAVTITYFNETIPTPTTDVCGWMYSDSADYRADIINCYNTKYSYMDLNGHVIGDETLIGQSQSVGVYLVTPVFNGNTLPEKISRNYNIYAIGGRLTIKPYTVASSISYISGIGKTYDGTTSASLDLSSITFMNISEQDKGKVYVLGVTGTYDTADVAYSSDTPAEKTISLDFSNAYLAGESRNNYVLDKTKAYTDQPTTTATILPKALSVSARVNNAASTTVLYGTTPAYSAVYSGFEAQDNSSSLPGTISYTASPAYSVTTVPGTVVSVLPGGYTKGNYSYTYVPATFTVIKNQLASVTPSWDEDQPGCVTWQAGSDISDARIGAYRLQLYKDNTFVTETTISRTDSSNYTTDFFREIIRTEGNGAYHVSLKVLADASSTDLVNDSSEALSGKFYAARVSISFANDAQTTSGKAANGNLQIVSPNGSFSTGTDTMSIVLLAGETATFTGIMKNGTGYTVQSVTSSDNGRLSVSTPGTAPDSYTDASYTGTVALQKGITSSDDIQTVITLASRKATLDFSLHSYYDGEALSAFVYGYDPARVVIGASPTTTAADNVDASQYTYSYSFSMQDRPAYKPGLFLQVDDAREYNEILWDYSASRTNTEGDKNFPSGLKVADSSKYYQITCSVTATRKDNGNTVSKTTSFILPVNAAVIHPTLEHSTWTYGETRAYPDIYDNPENMPVSYQYIDKSTFDADETAAWTTGRPVHAGTWYIRADVAEGSNFLGGTSTKTNAGERTTFTIHKAKLASVSSVSLTETKNGHSEYGLATWQSVTTFASSYEEGGVTITNANQTTLCENVTGSESISVSYHVVLKRDGTEVMATDTSATSMNMVDYMNIAGIYTLEVTAVSSDHENCLDADTATSPQLDISRYITVDNQLASSLDIVYDGVPRVLSVYNSYAGDQFFWSKDGQYIGSDTSIPVTDVSDSGHYTCTIHTSGGDQYTVSIPVTVSKRALTIRTASATKIYDSKALTFDTGALSSRTDGYSLVDCTLGAATVTHILYLRYTGSRTVSGSSDNTVDQAQTRIERNGQDVTADYQISYTYDTLSVTQKDLSELVMATVSDVIYNGQERKPLPAVTYTVDPDTTLSLTNGTDYTYQYEGNQFYGTATVTAIGKGNYKGQISVNFHILKKPLTVTSTDYTTVYDGNEHQDSFASGRYTSDGLVSGDSITGLAYTVTATDVVSRTNVINSAQVTRGSTDVTDSYDITYQYGSFSITKRPVTMESPSRSKVYDGVSLTDCQVTDTGFVSGQGAEYSFTGSQTVVGTSSNLFTYTLKSGTKAGNYQIAQPVYGVLTVTPRTAAIEWQNQNSFTFTNSPHTVKASVTNLAGGDTPALIYSNNAKTAVGNYTASVTGLSGNGNGNYVLPDNTDFSWSISYHAGGSITVSGATKTDSGWFTGDVTITPEDGYQICTDDSLSNWQNSIQVTTEGISTITYHLKETSTGYITEQRSTTVKLDKSNPVGSLTAGSFENISGSTADYQHFFRDSCQITVSFTDLISGCSKVEYQVVEEGSSYHQNGPWTEGSTLTLQAPKKAFVYVRLTDTAGNTRYLYTPGLVIFWDASADSEVTYTRDTLSNTAVTYTLSSNTILSVAVDGSVLMKGTDYSVNGNQAILTSTYTDTLSAGDHTLVTDFEAIGTTWKYGDRIASRTTTLKVLRNTANISSISDLSRTYGDPVPALTYLHTGDGVPVVSYYLNTTELPGAPSSPGTYKVRISLPQTEKYEATQAEKQFTITPASTGFHASLTTLTYVYDGTEKKPGVIVTYKGAVVPESEYTVSYVSNTNAGIAYVQISDVSGGNYTVNLGYDLMFEITKAQALLSISQTDYTRTYGDSNFTIGTVSHTGESPVTYVSSDTSCVTVSDGTVTIKGAGSTKVILSMAESANYLAATCTASITVLPRPVDLSWDHDAFTYDELEHSVNATVNNKVSSGDAITLTYQQQTMTDVGTCTTVVTAIDNNNYTLTGGSNLSHTWTISYLEGTADLIVTGDKLIPQSEWYTGNVTISAPSGYTYRISGESTWNTSQAITKEGTSTISYQLKNTATGYITAMKTAVIRLDSIAPAVSEPDTVLSEQDVTLRLNCTELTSGISSYAVKIAENGASGTTLYEGTIYRDGTHTEATQYATVLNLIRFATDGDLTLNARISKSNTVYTLTGTAMDVAGHTSSLFTKTFMSADSEVISVASTVPGQQLRLVLNVIEVQVTAGMYVIEPELQASYTDVSGIRDALFSKIRPYGGYTATDTCLYDIELQLSEDGGQSWRIAGYEDYPAEGILVTLSCPSGTNISDYDFSVAHMFDETATVTGVMRHAGDMETFSITKSASGISFRVYALSPVMIAWKTATRQNTYDGGSWYVDSPRTGDSFTTIYFLTLSTACYLSICLVKKRRKSHKSSFR